MKQQYIYGDWTKFSGLSLFLQSIGISDSIPIDAPDKFELVSEINLLEFEPTAPKNVVSQFHYNAHIQEDIFEKYVHIDDIEYHLSGTNLVPIITNASHKKLKCCNYGHLFAGNHRIAFLRNSKRNEELLKQKQRITTKKNQETIAET